MGEQDVGQDVLEGILRKKERKWKLGTAPYIPLL